MKYVFPDQYPFLLMRKDRAGIQAQFTNLPLAAMTAILRTQHHGVSYWVEHAVTGQAWRDADLGRASCGTVAPAEKTA